MADLPKGFDGPEYQHLPTENPMAKMLRRSAGMTLFFKAVEEFGIGRIECDMEDYGREPGDIVHVTLEGCGKHESHRAAGDLYEAVVEVWLRAQACAKPEEGRLNRG